ncbi:MAG: hypoxanthine phosphoribosyltransferase [Clostridia bacterium]|nr:hypoxanthine phosphoribosyltransferase [Clostridia bacterium]
MARDIDHVLIDEETILKRIQELADRLSNEYRGKDLVCICILKGAVVFYAELTKRMSVHMKMDFMSISSYGDAEKTSGIVRIMSDINTSITGKHVLVIEDIMDSGLTLNHLKTLLGERKPASLKIVCLLDKPSRRECDITPDYKCFEIPNEFAVGFGLDYAGKYRNLPYIGVLKPCVYQ